MFFYDLALTLQAPVGPFMKGIIEFHGYIWIFLLFIATFVLLFLLNIVLAALNYKKYISMVFIFYAILQSFLAFFNLKKDWISEFYKTNSLDYDAASSIVHATSLELIWTLTPSLILFLIAVPSFSLLYSFDEPINPIFTIKAIGYQWYWGYEYPDLKASHIINPPELSYMRNLKTTDKSIYNNFLRLLEADTYLHLPANMPLRLIVTASDVLHSFSVPALGIKIDAVPGRLNSVIIYSRREGEIYGQCSELCGANHGFMPIAVRIISPSTWIVEVSADRFSKEPNKIKEFLASLPGQTPVESSHQIAPTIANQQIAPTPALTANAAGCNATKDFYHMTNVGGISKETLDALNEAGIDKETLDAMTKMANCCERDASIFSSAQKGTKENLVEHSKVKSRNG